MNKQGIHYPKKVLQTPGSLLAIAASFLVLALVVLTSLPEVMNDDVTGVVPSAGHETRDQLQMYGSTGIVWSADHETGDLSQWEADLNTTDPHWTPGGSSDSGLCTRPANGVSTEYAHSGQYSMKMTIDTFVEKSSGCRQGRYEEIRTGDPFYYSVWLFLPYPTTRTGNFWNVFQFKNKDKDDNTQLIWVIDIVNDEDGEMRLRLRWKGMVPGPHEGDGIERKLYPPGTLTVPVGQWFHIEAYLRQSTPDGYDGQLIVWQDGVELYNLNQVLTRYNGGTGRWLINNYSDGLDPNPNTLYWDDAVISTTRVGPTDSSADLASSDPAP